MTSGRGDPFVVRRADGVMRFHIVCICFNVFLCSYVQQDTIWPLGPEAY